MGAEQLNTQSNRQLVALSRALPESMHAFRGLTTAVGSDGALDACTKELMAIAIAIVIHCRGCIAFHIAKAIKLGVSREAVLEAIAVSIEMGGGPE